MDPISNTDRLVRLLRQKLAERTQTKRASGPSQTGPVDARGLEKIRAVTGRLADAGVEDEQMRRALIEQLLVDQFGAAMINEPKFQQVIDRVHGIMKADPEIGSLLDQTLADLRREGI